MSQEFKILNTQTENIRENLSDIKGYVFRVLSNWKWFLLTIPIGLVIAYYVNISTQRIYGLGSTINVKEKQNSLFATGTNIAFNWGGTSDKVEGIRRTLSSRSHNEKVVRELKFYIQYLKEGRFRIEDAYGAVPFKVSLEPGQFQLLNSLIYIDFIDNENFKLSIDFKDQKSTRIINYEENLTYVHEVVSSQFSKDFRLDQPIKMPFLNLSIDGLEGMGNITCIGDIF